ncbi:hypothetical protein CHS0354_028184 [Potamilus streckersoni]|uniref:Uncharacterized protein n=1 Tax=Potamilus streckersoni TaxID=2493646 RepID=A0AAE0THZ7_9BIVA|nr:hypothetical protein CHS0354_028184 [Potamilus streckersoni]
MKLFRLRFILLGLLLCVFHVWCRTCGTEFADPGSSAYLAKVVILGVVSQKLPPSGNRYNVTVQFDGKGIKKGKELLKKGTRTTSLTIGEFGPKDLEDCVDEINRDGKYYFFLNVSSDSSFFRVSALPVGGDIPKKIRREIEKLSQCKMDDTKCVTIPTMKTKMKDTVLEENKQLQLQCNVKKAPVPKAEFIWLKDEVVIKEKKIQIKHGKKGSRLRIRQVSISDEGKYACVVKNAAGSVKQEAVIKIAHERKKPCGNNYEGYCMNKGTCFILMELNQTYCECQLGYTGQHCGELIIPPIASSPDLNKLFDEIRNIDKLNHERTLIIIGIIVGILAFIGICVASYFLVKRRNKLFYRRQGEKRQTIEDNIPQVYRPLLSGCDEVDGPRPKVKASTCISRETQTIESSFSSANGNLYVNPLDGILRFSPTDKNKINRNRLPAVCLEGLPGSSRQGNGHDRVSNSDQNPRHNPENMSKEEDQNPRHIPDNMAKEGVKEVSLRGAPSDSSKEEDIKGKETSLKLSENQDPKEKDLMSSKNPERKLLNEQMSSPVPHFSSVAVGNPHKKLHSHGANISEDAIPNHKFPDFHVFNIDTESDSDEATQTETPLLPLFISEEDIATEDISTPSYHKGYGLDELENLAVENAQNSMSPYINDVSSDSCINFSDSLGDKVKSKDSLDKNKPMDRNAPLKYSFLDPLTVSSHFWNEHGSLEQGMDAAGLAYSQEKQSKHDQIESEYFQPALPFSSNRFGKGVKT